MPRPNGRATAVAVASSVVGHVADVARVMPASRHDDSGAAAEICSGHDPWNSGHAYSWCGRRLDSARISLNRGGSPRGSRRTAGVRTSTCSSPLSMSRSASACPVTAPDLLRIPHRLRSSLARCTHQTRVFVLNRRSETCRNVSSSSWEWRCCRCGRCSPAKKIQLGLDLKGGSDLVLRVDTDDTQRLETQTAVERDVRDWWRMHRVDQGRSDRSKEFVVEGVRDDAEFRAAVAVTEEVFTRSAATAR